MRRAVRFLRDTPCAALLIVQLLGVIVYPFLEGSVAGRSALAVFGLAVLALVVRAVRATPMLWWVSVTLAIPALGLLLVQAVTLDDSLAPYSAVFEALLYFYAAVSMLVYMLADERVTTDEMFAVGAVFTLLAWAFAYTYVVVQALDPGSFTAAVQPDQPRTWTELLFLSFTTLSSTGLSDIVPVHGHSRSVVMLEQVVGLFYIAMVVTRLVGLNMARVNRRRD
ncbi:two pore domain potassium channel family protein [Nocardioides mesophilus]|uniref:Two pore domain potassium channel family protein n=1 Tax=Nocardioides mesophilus TaxID=433659 RepID=A0A7G9REQ1_9ACTN|nr:two pore domain potassium channel family protein [Nocardioides mesophilus]QNN54076.1 two pore domain potassium channel family protein [Nocardioides mesophilus]